MALTPRMILVGIAWNVLLSAGAEIRVDASIPAGNIVCERIEGDHLYLHPDQRGSSPSWFYWAFRVTGAEGRKLTFHFTEGEPVGLRGPAISADKGLSWNWLNKDFTSKDFSYTFASEEIEVWFALGMIYTQRDWERFLKTYQNSSFIEASTLTSTRKGRPVEQLRVGCIAKPPRNRILLVARHHACEMMASYVLEGLIAGVLEDDDKGKWLRDHAEFLVIPFMDKDGVEEGDQGKNRSPHDHNRDYSDKSLHVETDALRKLAPSWANGKLTAACDFHCPSLRGMQNERVLQVGNVNTNIWAQQQVFGRLLEQLKPNTLAYFQFNDQAYGKGWNAKKKIPQGARFDMWASELPGVSLVTTFEIPYATANEKEVNILTARQFGRNVSVALRQYLSQLEK